MSGSNLPKLRDAMNLRTSDTSNITHYQIQSAMELRLESMDGDPRTIHCSVSSLPCPVRSSIYSDPGNVLLAENLRQNDNYLAKILNCRSKSAPTGLLHPSMGISTRSQSDPSYCRSTVSTKPALVRSNVRSNAVTRSGPLYSDTQPDKRRTNSEKSVSLNKTSDRVIFVRTNPLKTEHLRHNVSRDNVSRDNVSRPVRQVHTSQNKRPVHSPVRRRAASCITRNRTYPETPRVNYTITRRTRSVSVSAYCRGKVTWRNGHSLNSKRAQNMAWSRDNSKSSQGLSLSSICRALPISYNNFLVETVAAAPLT